MKIKPLEALWTFIALICGIAVASILFALPFFLELGLNITVYDIFLIPFVAVPVIPIGGFVITFLFILSKYWERVEENKNSKI